MKHESKTQQQAFRMERVKRNLTIRDVAEKLGVSAQLICLYENDTKTVLSRRAGIFPAICALYDMNPEEIGRLVDKQREAERKVKA